MTDRALRAGDHLPCEQAAPAPGHDRVGLLALALRLAPGRAGCGTCLLAFVCRTMSCICAMHTHTGHYVCAMRLALAHAKLLPWPCDQDPRRSLSLCMRAEEGEGGVRVRSASGALPGPSSSTPRGGAAGASASFVFWDVGDDEKKKRCCAAAPAACAATCRRVVPFLTWIWLVLLDDQCCLLQNLLFRWDWLKVQIYLQDGGASVWHEQCIMILR